MQVTFDAADPAKLAEFWCGVLGYQVAPRPEFATWDQTLDAWRVPPQERNLARRPPHFRDEAVFPAGFGVEVG